MTDLELGSLEFRTMRILSILLLTALVVPVLTSCTSLKRHELESPGSGTTDPLASYSVLAGAGLEEMDTQPLTDPKSGKPESRLESNSTGLEGPLKLPGNNNYVSVERHEVAPTPLPGDGIVLNFENADLREVVRTILGDFLKISYIYDPKVQGSVSLQTTKPLAPDAVLATLETLLRMNGGALVTGDPYRVVTADAAQKSKVVPQLGDDGTPLPAGFQVLIVPLQFVAAAQMEKLLEPFVAPQSILRVDSERNLLLLAGTSGELSSLLETVGIFDVDWLAGKSIGLFPLSQVTPEDMVTELNAIFGTDQQGPLAGMVRFQPINRLNALLVISVQSAYLNKVEQWIERLDRSSSAGQNLYVYYLQNGKAADVAKILTEVFSGREENRRNQQAGRLAPGLTPVEMRTPAQPQQPAAQPQAAAAPAPAPAIPAAPAVRTSEGLAFSETADIRIIADEINNSLLILASPPDYRMVVAAINKLDIVPLQVLIEATIAEVKLTDEMKFGLQWFFGSGEFKGTLNSRAPTHTAASILPAFTSGFSLVYENVSAKAILDALDSETSVNVVSSPHLMVLDNQTASLQVGDEVPVTTRQQQSTATDTANIINTIEYRDTGVIMNVTPRVNASGSIIMEIEQEVSTVAEESANNTPTISQRKFKSSVVVQSGDTVVLGGLISDQKNKTRAGLPLISEVPVVGALFGQTTVDDRRTELVMLITPRLVRNRHEASRVTDEVRRRLNSLRQLQEDAMSKPLWGDFPSQPLSIGQHRSPPEP